MRKQRMLISQCNDDWPIENNLACAFHTITLLEVDDGYMSPKRVTFGPNAQMTSLSKMTSKQCMKLLWFLKGFAPAHKSCTKLFSDKIVYKWYKYIISLQNYLIKLNWNVLIKSYQTYICHAHCSWCYRHLL